MNNNKSITIKAFLISESIFLKKFKNAYKQNLISGSSSDAFYQIKEESYVFILNYGVVVFANVLEEEINHTLNLLKDYLYRPLESKISETYQVIQNSNPKPQFQYEELLTPEMSPELLKIVMFNLAHSVALDFYENIADQLLSEIQEYAIQLEEKGKIKGSKKNMLRFIGKILSVKNKIVENLYIFDVPEMVWESPDLNHIHIGLSTLFDIRTRFKEIEYTFKVIEDNLEVFSEIFQHNESSRLEIIIIVLIFIEVLNLFVEKLLK